MMYFIAYVILCCVMAYFLTRTSAMGLLWGAIFSVCFSPIFGFLLIKSCGSYGQSRKSPFNLKHLKPEHVFIVMSCGLLAFITLSASYEIYNAIAPHLEVYNNLNENWGVKAGTHKPEDYQPEYWYVKSQIRYLYVVLLLGLGFLSALVYTVISADTYVSDFELDVDGPQNQ